jgi:murein DD-endopeptidase MepM/ murein hydrolase activator NlpD
MRRRKTDGRRTVRRLLGALLVALAPVTCIVARAAAQQDPPRFELPLACDIPAVCAIQNYVDADPGPAARDHTCGTLTYDGHKGTDFMLRDRATMLRGIDVLAAAGGVVRNIRDGEPDGGVAAWRRAGANGRELGNGVAIDHGAGWETLYGHMRKGSVAVRPGDRVDAGQRVGRVGFSGLTEFPHLHFQVLKDGRVVDPFVGQESAAACGGDAAPIWTASALARLDYRPSILVCGGFAVAEPQRDAIQEACPALGRASRNAAALIVFAEIAGVQKDDTLRLSITGPDGATIAGNEMRISRDRARQFRYAGKRRPNESWDAGSYTASVLLVRDSGAVAIALIDAEFTVTLD